jgi:hypothetical protein
MIFENTFLTMTSERDKCDLTCVKLYYYYYENWEQMKIFGAEKYEITGGRIYAKTFSGNKKGKDYSEYVQIDGIKILEWILMK